MPDRPSSGQEHSQKATHSRPSAMRKPNARCFLPITLQYHTKEPDMQLHNKRVLITGGSSGIGFALAQAFVARGAKVFITGRRQSAPDEPQRRLQNRQQDRKG